MARLKSKARGILRLSCGEGNNFRAMPLHTSGYLFTMAGDKGAAEAETRCAVAAGLGLEAEGGP